MAYRLAARVRSVKGKQRMSLTLREKKRGLKKQRAVSKKERTKARKDLRALRKKLKEEMEAEISRYLNDLDDNMKFKALGSKPYPNWGVTQ